MIPHLATILAPLFADAAAPDATALKMPTVWEGLELGTIGAIVVIGILVGYGLRKFQNFRSDMAKEIKRELTAVAEANRIRYELATRLPVSSLLTDARKESNTDAIARLRDVAKGTMRIVQPADAAPDTEQAIPKLEGYYGSNPKIPI